MNPGFHSFIESPFCIESTFRVKLDSKFERKYSFEQLPIAPNASTSHKTMYICMGVIHIEVNGGLDGLHAEIDILRSGNKIFKKARRVLLSQYSLIYLEIKSLQLFLVIPCLQL